jgi:hypothetical protein
MELDIQSERWFMQVKRALLNVENCARLGDGEKPYHMHDVWIECTPLEKTRLFNLKVWTQRYSVNLEFVLEFLLTYYRDFRKRYGLKHQVSFGIPLATLTGLGARAALEEHIKRVYPARENYRDATQSLRRQMVGQRTVHRVDYQIDPDLMTLNYQKALQAPQQSADPEADPDAEDLARRRRPWRGNPF